MPAFQEEGSVGNAVRELAAMCERLTRWRWEIIVIDDGSPDGTSAEAAEAAAQAGGGTLVRVLRQPCNTGLGGALKAGIMASQGDLVLTVDCDLSYSTRTLEDLEAAFVERQAQVVIASPYMPGGECVAVPPALALRSRAANKWLQLVSLDNIYTLTGMVRAYDGPFVRSLALKAVGADINVEILYKAQLLRATIVEIPAVLDWSGILHRRQRNNLFAERQRWATYKQLVNGYLWRPFWFPLMGALLAAVPAIVLTVTGHLGWHGAAVAFAVISVLLVFQSLSALQTKRYFEELFNLGTGMARTVGLPQRPLIEVHPSNTDRPVADPGRPPERGADPTPPAGGTAREDLSPEHHR